jgi:hypothetical protein
LPSSFPAKRDRLCGGKEQKANARLSANKKMKEENQIKTSPTLDLKKGKISLRKVRGMGATVANNG